MVSFTDKADRHYIAEIVLKVALSTLTLTPLTTIIKAYICIHRLLQNEVQQTLVKRGTHCKCRLGNSQCRLRNSQCRLGNNQCRLGNNQWFCLFASKFNPFVGGGHFMSRSSKNTIYIHCREIYNLLILKQETLSSYIFKLYICRQNYLFHVYIVKTQLSITMINLA